MKERKIYKMKRIVLAAALSSMLFAVQNSSENEMFSPETLKALNEKEAVTKTPDDLKQNNFYLNINPKDIKKLQEKDKVIQEHLDKFDGAILNYKPVIRPIMTNDEIQVHPYFSTTILLPVGANISYPDISIPPEILKAEQNTVIIRMKKDFEIGNLTLIYKIGDTNYVMNIMLKRYDRSKTDEKLSLVYSYEKINKKNDLEVINAFVKTNGKYPNKAINYIWLDGITYRIILDNKNGNVMINNKKYLVDIGNTQ
jgi:hypothetical protein